MTTLVIGLSGAARASVTQGFYGALSRGFGGMTDSALYRSLSAIGVALGGVQSSVEIDTSTLSRVDLSALVRALESYDRDIPNAHCLTSFARAIETADRAANPNAGRLRDV